MSTALPLIVLGYVVNNVNNALPNFNSIDSIPTTDARLPEQLLQLQARRYGYTYITDIGAYKFHTQKADWNTARKICEEEGGYLAIINSIAESEALGTLLRNSDPYLHNTQVDDAGYAHIGFHELYKTDEWTTIHGESLTVAGFFVWSPGEPNRRGNQQHCGSIYKDGKLNDVECSLYMNFICELPRVSFSSIIILPQTGAAQTFPLINPRSG